ncbi:MAG: 23S rRNA (pseudouridine(1915)-N(3))-methyltransferase RlmH [Spirochaetota bacterium]|jgi:23S rRNA (pseudouridine1915-N3)-methyltransferase|nr:23S rRNA (pseudouridine(1915)-N(3))-methyltransferase RlmH [Spirochaetota bacterium]
MAAEIRLYCVGKLSAQYVPLFQDYADRLRHFGRFLVTEIPEPRGKFANPEEKIMRSSREILARLGDAPYYAFDSEGSMFTSREFSQWFFQDALQSRDVLRFALGGAEGLSAQFLARAEARISFSRLTFPHQLFRILAAEQIYRAFTLHTGLPYHK